MPCLLDCKLNIWSNIFCISVEIKNQTNNFLVKTGIRSEPYTIAISLLLLFIYPGLIRFPSGIPKPYDYVCNHTEIWMRPVYNKYPELRNIQHLNK